MFTILEERKKHGFTLVELVVVIGIMSVLSAILIPAVIHYAEDSRVQRDDSAMAEIVNMTKTIMDSNIEAYDELYSIGQFVADGDAGVYIVWKDMGEKEGFVPYVMEEKLEDMAPVFYSELKQTLEGPVYMQSGSYRGQFFVVTLEKDEDDELTWVSGEWSETNVVNTTTGDYEPITPDIPSNPTPPILPTDIPGIPPVDEDAGDENAPVSQPEDEKKDKPAATGTPPQGKRIQWNGEAHLLAVPGDTAQGTYYYKLSSDSSGLWQSGVPKATNVGEYQISYYIKGSADYQDSAVGMISASIIPGESHFTPPTATDTVFTGDPITLIALPGTTTPADKVHMVYSLDKTTWDPTPPARTQVGAYTVFYKLVCAPEIVESTEIYSVTAYIRAWEGNFAMPDAANPTYTGSAQKLLLPGTAPDGCTVYYRTETGAWGTAIPTATEAGSYKVYYKIDGGGKYTDVGETLVNCEIKKATPILALSSTRTIFNPPATKATITINNNSDGALTLSSSDAAVATATLSNNNKSFDLQALNQGSAIITLSVAATNNFHAASVQHNVEVTIGAITATATDGKATYNGMPQDGGARVFVTTPAVGYTIQYREQGDSSWQSSMPLFTNAGTYSIEYAISAEGFAQKTGIFTIQIEKATATDTIKPKVTGYEWIQDLDGYTASFSDMKDGDGSPEWQLASATVNYTTLDGYSINDKISSIPTITEPGELRLTDLVFKDKTGNHQDITVNTFMLHSRIDGTLTASNTLILKCYTAEGDETIYYRVQNGTLYLRKTNRTGYSATSLTNMPAGNMFLSDNETAGITTVHIETVLLPVSMYHWFANLPDLQQITYNVIDGQRVELDTRYTTTLEGLFENCTNLQTDENGDIPGMDWAEMNLRFVTSMENMFAGCKSIDYINLSTITNQENLTTAGMFQGCSNLTEIVFGGSIFTQSNQTMDYMFKDCVNLKHVDLRGIMHTDSTSMLGMFENTIKLETITTDNNFQWSSPEEYVPVIDSQNVTGADGKWYDITNAEGYTPAQLANYVSNDPGVKTFSSIPYYWLDMINGMRDGIKSDTLEGLATVDVYIDGQLMQRDAVDWYHPYKYGTRYEFKNLTLTSNLGYKGLQTVVEGDTLSGILTHEKISWLKFETIAAEFQYTGGIQTFTAPAAGYYQIEIWGAQGGNTISNGFQVGTGCAGGYSKGNVYLDQDQTIYIAVGGQGQQPVQGADPAGGWNGGGKGAHDHSSEGSGADVGGAGGGATSICLSLIGDGQLSNYTNNQHQVVIVAGGGSGSIWENPSKGGVGGGAEGGTGGVEAATQTSGHAFGQGQDAVWPSTWGKNASDWGLPGGGGGWYGGKVQHSTSPTAGGGSGYIGGVVNGSMASGIRKGNGLAKITYSGAESYSVPTSQSFEYTGYMQKFVVPISGYYKLEAWGAEGGVGTVNSWGIPCEPGRGGYTSGITYLTEGTTLFVYVGEYGIDQFQSTVGFNGGGAAYGYTGTSQPHIGGRGGGATDIRLVDGDWDDLEGLKSRILVAGGGGGAQSTCGKIATAGHGGGLVGTTSFNMGYQERAQDVARTRAFSEGGSQTTGGRGYNINDTFKEFNYPQGGFGYGATAVSCASGGGGGWYGGGSSYTSGGGGGSSYVTGYPGCDTTYRELQGGYEFTHVSIIAGLNTGNGKAKITYMGEKAPARGGTLTIDNAMTDVGTFDLYVDGMLAGSNIVSYIGEIAYGSTWDMEPVRNYSFNNTQWKYLCAERHGLNGTLRESGTVHLRWKYDTSTLVDFGTISDGDAIVANQEVLWELNETTLEITPANGATGTIKNLMPQENMPWSANKGTIKTVTTSGRLYTSEYFCRAFYGFSALTTANLQSIDVSNALHLDELFYGCRQLAAFNGFSGNAYVETFNKMFLDCVALKAINMSSMNAINDSIMTSMFSGVPLQQIETPTYWHFTENCGLSVDTNSKWNHELAGTVSFNEFMELVTNTQYAGTWTKQ